MTESCIICLAPALHPVRLTCRCTMRACADCLFHWFYRSVSCHGVPIEKKTCPTCRRADVDALLVDEKTGDTRPLNLMEMAKRGDKELVTFMIHLGAKWKISDDDGLTPLGAAAGGGHLDLVKMLIEEWGVRINQADGDGETPLFAACYGGATEVVKYLVSKGATPSKADSGKWYPVCAAACKGHLAIVQFLVEEAGVDPNKCLDKQKTNAAMEAASRGHLDVVRYLLETGPKRLPAGAVDKDGTNALLEALTNGHESIALYLLNQFGADAGPDAKDSCGMNAIFAAARGNCLEAANILHTKYGLAVNERDEDDTDVPSWAVSWCPENHIVPFLKWLATCGIDLTKAHNDDGHLLTQQRGARALPVMQYLVDELGMSPTAAAKDGTTPLYIAISFGSVDTVKYLEGKGANAFGARFEGASMLLTAIQSSNVDVARYVLERCPAADITAADDDLVTPLHRAVSRLPASFVQELLDRGANPAALNDDGETPLFIAAGSTSCETLAIVKLLASRGGDALLVKTSTSGETPMWQSANAVRKRRRCIIDHNACLARIAEGASASAPENRLWTTNKSSSTPLDVEEVAQEVLRYFLSIPPVSAPDHLLAVDKEYGYTVFHEVAGNGDAVVLQRLIDAFRKDREHEFLQLPSDKKKRTPLHHAAEAGNLHALKVLMESFGFMASVRDSKGLTPKMLANRIKAHECAALLRTKDRSDSCEDFAMGDDVELNEDDLGDIGDISTPSLPSDLE